jgi:mitochondrial Rho GTPase 1
MTTLLNHRTTLEYLAYLGYPDTPRTSALQITRPRKSDRRRGKLTRNVLLGYVCGAAGSGKTSLLRAFVGRRFSEVYEPTKRMNSVVNMVDIDGREVYLVVSRPHCRSSRLLIRWHSYKSSVRGMRQKC